jgi:hypothetical protein
MYDYSLSYDLSVLDSHAFHLLVVTITLHTSMYVNNSVLVVICSGWTLVHLS